MNVVINFLKAALVLTCIVITSDSIAQFTGTTTPVSGSTSTYTCYDDGYYLFTLPDWTISPAGRGTVTSVAIKIKPTNNYMSVAGIEWNEPGPATITVTYGSYYTYTYNVVVSCSSTPGAPTIATPAGICATGSTTLIATPGAGGAGIKWYTASTGGTLRGSSTSFTTPTISADTTYYAASTNSSGFCGSTRTAVTVHVNALPAAPSGKVDSVRCGNGEVTISAIPASPATSIKWYTTATGGDLVGTGTNFTTPTLSSSIYRPATYSYYAASYNSGTGCVSSSRLEVKATVNPPPSKPRFTQNIVYGSGVINLQAEHEFYRKIHLEPTYFIPDTALYEVRWFVDSAKAVANTPTFYKGSLYNTPVINQTTKYFVRTLDKEAGCLGPVGPAIAKVLPIISTTSIKTEVVRVAGVKTENELNALNDSLKSISITHLDGLGRVNQQVALKASPNGYDIVQPMEYDNHGRISKQYLPYASDSVNGSFQSGYELGQSTFYQNASKVAHDAYPYAKSVYEDSPLGRPIEQTSAGQAWQPGSGHTNKMVYGFNTGATSSEAEEVRKFNADGSSSGFYAANMLSRTEGINADGIHAITFTDASGQTIATKQQLDETIGGTTVNYLETYYVYDDFGRVKYMIQPEGVAALKANGWNLTMPIKKQFVFQYIYDSRGRVTETRVPGKGWSYTVYNSLNQPVLTQDTLLKITNQWLFMKYDHAGRVVMTGLFTDNTHTTRSYFQTLLNGKNYNTERHFEKRDASGTHKYTNLAFPTTNIEVLSVNYYDTYDFDSYAAYDQHGVFSAGIQGQSIGKVTGSKTLIPGTSTWLKKFVYYDSDGRTIQVRSNNHLSTTPDNLTSTVYDFEKVLSTKTLHKVGSDTLTVRNKYDYYKQGRLKHVRQKNKNNAEQLVVKYEYNELGQVVDKKLHRKSDGNYLQSVDYRYAINGQLASINNATLDANGTANDDTNDYFGMELLYDNNESGLTTTQRYDGMISAIKWKTIGDSQGTVGQRGYAYSYDKSGKLKTAGYARKESLWNQEVGAQNEAMTYDRNGNIKSLTRKQRKYQLADETVSYTNETIDNLTYAYTNTTSNNLEKVTDAAGAPAPAGFSNGASGSGNDYTYDVNGNILSDKNKGIDSVKYNFLGKPVRMKFSDGKLITYTYDAGGNKLTQKLYTGSTLVTTTEYVNGFVYQADSSASRVLTFFGSPEGRVVNNGGTLQHEYSIADHQGNTRIVFSAAAPAVSAPVTNFESNSAGFLNFPSGGTLSDLEFFDHTDAGTVNKKSMVLNGGYNSHVGVAKTFKVYPGDKIKAEAYVKYEEEDETPDLNNLSGFANMLTGVFGVSSSSAGEALKVYNSLSSYGGAVASGTAHSTQPDNEDAPKAFVTIIFFDKNHNYLDAAWQQVGEGFTQDPNFIVKDSFDHVVKEVIAKEEGYAYVFISNESPNFMNVYFDDVKFTHTPSNVIQYNEYYPYGLQTSTSWTRDQAKDNNYLYNAANELNKTNGWYEMYYRGYDPAIGRMLQVDPYAPMYASSTTYNYALNNPVMMNDPSGGLTSVVGYTDGQLRTMFRQNRYNGGTADFGDWAADNLDGRDAGTRNINGGDGNTYAFDVGGTLVKGGAWVQYSAGESDGKGGMREVYASLIIWEETGRTRYEPFQDNDPSLKFHFMNESAGYKYMLEMQKKDQVEVVGVLTKNASGKVGILILPWFTNRYDWSNPKKGFNGEYYEDRNGNRYSPLAIIHTHPENDMHHSKDDMKTAREFNIPMYILGETSYRQFYPKSYTSNTYELIRQDHPVSLVPK